MSHSERVPTDRVRDGQHMRRSVARRCMSLGALESTKRLASSGATSRARRYVSLGSGTGPRMLTGGMQQAALENMSKILKSAGTDTDNILKVNIFLSNLKEDFAPMNEVYGAVRPSAQRGRSTRLTRRRAYDAVLPEAPPLAHLRRCRRAPARCCHRDRVHCRASLRAIIRSEAREIECKRSDV